MNVAGTVYRRFVARPTLSLMNTTNDTTQARSTTNAPTTNAAVWSVDPIHTTVGFAIRHLMVTTVRGIFEKVTGTVRYAPGEPEAAQIEVTIDPASVRTHDRQRDEHLQDPDFFDVARYPTIAFRSTAVCRGAGGGHAVKGELTLRGITRPITLAVHEIAGPHRDFRGARRIGATATAKLLRSDFGITYNIVLEAGGIALADEVALTIDLSLIEKVAR